MLGNSSQRQDALFAGLRVLHSASSVLYFNVCYSRGDFGRLGHGNSSDLFIPHPIKALSGLQIKQIACGDSHCLAITADGDVHRYFFGWCCLVMSGCL